MRRGIVYLSMLSDACRAELHELCRDATCECHVCHGDDLEPLHLDPQAEDAAILEFDRRADRRADR